MNNENIGILHPGSMGVSVAASAKNGGHAVFWSSAGRSPQTHERAQQSGLEDTGTLAQLCARCSVIVSVCPPVAAEDLAHEVLAHGFTGLYVDANAIAPERAERIHAAVVEAGASFVDGGIIGGPAWKPASTWLYLSGAEADRAAACFAAGPLVARVVGATPGKASALKMCFAAYTKGTTALLCAIMAAAEALDVRAELEAQWSENGSDFAEQTTQRVRNVTDRAWRFVGEMDEIATTLSGAGVPGEFHRAAGEIYQRIAHFKDAESPPPLEDVLAALLNRTEHE